MKWIPLRCFLIAANNQESDSAKFGLYQGCETTSNLVCIAAELASHRGVWCYYIEEISLFSPKENYCYIVSTCFGSSHMSCRWLSYLWPWMMLLYSQTAESRMYSFWKKWGNGIRVTGFSFSGHSDALNFYQLWHCCAENHFCHFRSEHAIVDMLLVWLSSLWVEIVAAAIYHTMFCNPNLYSYWRYLNQCLTFQLWLSDELLDFHEWLCRVFAVQFLSCGDRSSRFWLVSQVHSPLIFSASDAQYLFPQCLYHKKPIVVRVLFLYIENSIIACSLMPFYMIEN